MIYCDEAQRLLNLIIEKRLRPTLDAMLDELRRHAPSDPLDHLKKLAGDFAEKSTISGITPRMNPVRMKQAIKMAIGRWKKTQ